MNTEKTEKSRKTLSLSDPVPGWMVILWILIAIFGYDLGIGDKL